VFKLGASIDVGGQGVPVQMVVSEHGTGVRKTPLVTIFFDTDPTVRRNARLNMSVSVMSDVIVPITVTKVNGTMPINTNLYDVGGKFSLLWRYCRNIEDEYSLVGARWLISSDGELQFTILLECKQLESAEPRAPLTRKRKALVAKGEPVDDRRSWLTGSAGKPVGGSRPVA